MLFPNCAVIASPLMRIALTMKIKKRKLLELYLNDIIIRLHLFQILKQEHYPSSKNDSVFPTIKKEVYYDANKRFISFTNRFN
jgi:hypothetical protein